MLQVWSKLRISQNKELASTIYENYDKEMKNNDYLAGVGKRKVLLCFNDNLRLLIDEQCTIIMRTNLRRTRKPCNTLAINNTKHTNADIVKNKYMTDVDSIITT